MDILRAICVAKHIEENYKIISFDAGQGKFVNYLEDKEKGGSIFFKFSNEALGELREY